MGFGGFLKQSTAVDVLIGPFVDSTDGDTEETGLTIAQADVRLSKNGQTAAQKNDDTTCVHDADGFYNCELDATDTNTVGQLVLYVHESGALAVRHDFQVVEEAIYDALYGASATGLLPANVTQIGGVSVSTTTAQIGVNVVEISGDSTSADNLESYTDGTTPMPVNATQISGDGTAADNLEAMLDGTGGTTLTTAITGNITGNLSGSVGSVTGAVGSVTGNVGGNVAGSVASVTGAVGSVTGNVGGNVTGSIGSLATQAKADVNAEVVDTLATDTYAEPGQGAPGATVSLKDKIGYIYKAWRNRNTTDATNGHRVYADNGTTIDHEATVSDDGTTFDRGEFGTGA